MNKPLEKPKIIIPQKAENISLTKFVDWTAKAGNLQKLREVALPENSFEIRIWIAKSIGVDGLVIKKDGEKWTAIYVDKTFDEKTPNEENKYLKPKSGWKELWKKLTEAEILTLPDSSELKDYNGDKITDGFGYIVEINKDKIYRIYEYSNPNWAENPEAKQMVKISKIIAEEFGLEEFYFDKESGQKLT
ncbi:MAG: hypothetical protein ACR2MD_03260 [Aridibacter sp.]